jgi:site-specific recombinase XerD
MSGDLVLLPALAEAANLPALLQDLAEKAQDYAAKSMADNTRRAYDSDWRAFEAWCQARGFRAMPAAAGTVLAYITDRAGALKVSTLSRHLAAIRAAHSHAGTPLDLNAHPGFREVWKGIKREHGTARVKKTALLTPELRQGIEALPDTLHGLRDRALLLLGFAGALRRSELVGLHVDEASGAAWIEAKSDGLVLHLTRTKTDQQGEGTSLGIPYGANPDTCPVRAYLRWREAAGIGDGPAFRGIDRHGNIAPEALSDKGVARIVKRTVKAGALAQGHTEKAAERVAARYAGHSLRSGLATSAAMGGAAGHQIQKHLRHKRYDTTAGYIRAASLFKDNAAGAAGL